MKPYLRQTALFLSIAVFTISGCEQHPAQSNNAPNPALHTQNRQGETRSADDLMFPALTEQDIAKAVRPDPADQAPLQMPKLTVSDSSQQGQQDSSAAKPPEQTQASPAPAPVRQTDKKPVAAAKEKSASTATKKSTVAKRLTLAQLVQKYPDLLLLKGSSKSKQIALTFDDAPDTKYTLQVLDILKKYDVRATFFVVGRLAEKHPAVIKRMHKEGHVVGNHTYNHALLTKLSVEQFQSQIAKTQIIVKNAIGYTPRLIRPPYGEILESQLLWASKNNYVIVNWNVDSKDWKQLSQEQVTDNILSHAASGSIVLQHSGGGPRQNLSGTVAALPTIIESLQSRGYKLVTLPELLNVSKQL